jgi:CheY-like chemotaxis protein
MTADDSPPISVLLVEDDPGDVVLIEEAFEHNTVRNPLTIVGDGVEAMEYLRGDDCDRPDLVLLDLYDLHANAHATRPVDFSRFIEVVRQIDEFFVTVVELPGHRPPPA